MQFPFPALPPQIAAGTSQPFQANKQGQILTVSVVGLQGSETATLQKLDIFTNTYKPYLIDAANPTFSVNNNVIGLDGAGSYVVVKSQTQAEVGVMVEAFDF